MIGLRTARRTALAALIACGAAAIAPAAASAAPDLVVAISGAPDPAVPGDTLTVKVTAANLGDTAATGSYIGIVMLDDVTLGDGPECVNFLGRLAVCDVGTLAPGATVQRSFTFSDLKVGELRLQGNASSDKADAKPDDNVAHGTVQVEPRADLKLGLDVSRSVAAARANAAVTATVRNASSGPARAAKLQVEVAKGISVLRLPHNCHVDSRRVICELGTVSSGETVTRTIPVRAPARRTFSLIGGVTWARRDATPADNQAQTLLTTLARTSVVSLSRLIRGVPRSRGCVHRRRLTLRIRGASHVRRLDLYVAGKRVRQIRGRRLRRAVHLRHLPHRTYTVRAQSTLRDGRHMVAQRRVIACGARAR